MNIRRIEDIVEYRVDKYLFEQRLIKQLTNMEYAIFIQTKYGMNISELQNHWEVSNKRIYQLFSNVQEKADRIKIDLDYKYRRI